MSLTSEFEPEITGEECTYYSALNYLTDTFQEFNVTLADVDSHLRDPWTRELERGLNVCEIYPVVVPMVERTIRGRLERGGDDGGEMVCVREENVVPGKITPINELPVLLDVPLRVIPARTMMRAPPRPWQRRG